MSEEKPKVFISHSWDDNAIARKFAEYLRRDGAEVWIDYARIKGGDSLPDAIGEGIEWCNTFLLVWSKSAKDSYYVKLERNCAIDNRKRIIPCVIDNEKVPTILTAFLRIDFNNFEQGYRSLARGLNLVINEKQPETEKPVIVTPPEKFIARPTVVKPEITIFRSSPKELSEDAVTTMLKKYGLFDRYMNENGKGFNHHYEQQTIKGDKIIIDHASGLMWQQSGSLDGMSYDDAKEYINKLNRDRFGGFDKWRLPTLEEAMSLMEPAEKNKGLYIDPMFDRKQRWIWTADQDQVQGASWAWVVGFGSGGCGLHLFYSEDYVRAVRFGQLSQE